MKTTISTAMKTAALTAVLALAFAAAPVAPTISNLVTNNDAVAGAGNGGTQPPKPDTKCTNSLHFSTLMDAPTGGTTPGDANKFCKCSYNSRDWKWDGEAWMPKDGLVKIDIKYECTFRPKKYKTEYCKTECEKLLPANAKTCPTEKDDPVPCDTKAPNPDKPAPKPGNGTAKGPGTGGPGTGGPGTGGPGGPHTGLPGLGPITPGGGHGGGDGVVATIITDGGEADGAGLDGLTK